MAIQCQRATGERHNFQMQRGRYHSVIWDHQQVL